MRGINGYWIWGVVLAVGMTCRLSGAEEPIQIFSKGKKYDSIKLYNQSQRAMTPRVVKNDQQSVREVKDSFQDFIKNRKDAANFRFDPDKVKTIVMEPAIEPKADPKQQALKKISVDGSVEDVIKDFKTDEIGSRERVDPYELEDVLRQVLETQPDPAMIVADDEKLRVVVHGAEETKESVQHLPLDQHKTEKRIGEN